MLAAALVVAVFALPALAGKGFQATLSGDADPDGSGSALLQIDTKTSFGTVCHETQVENVSRPITGGIVSVGESGELVGRLIIQDRGGTLEGCTAQAGIKNRDLMRIQKDPAGRFLHLYNDGIPATSAARTGPARRER